MEKESLDPHYFSTTPKNSWELFKWGFTEKNKLNDFSKEFSRKKSIVWFLKVYFWVVFTSILYIFLIKLIFVYFDIPIKYSSYFKDTFIEGWYSSATFYNKFFFDIKSIYTLGLVFFLLFIFGLLGRIFKFDFRRAIETVLIFGFTASIFFGLSFAYLKDETLSLLIMGTILILLELSVLFAIYTYPYYAIKDIFFKPTLERNAYLENAHILIPVWKLAKYLSEDSFNRPELANSFIRFLFEFRKSKRNLAFHLTYVVDASRMYNNLLSPLAIKSPKVEEKDQFNIVFSSTLIKLRKELNTYQLQHNIYHKKTSLSNVVEILNELEQQMIMEKRGWSEYYLKAIRANLDEAHARLKNLELEAKKREPITPNIYNIGDPLSPNYQNQLFKGRKDVVDRLSNIIYTSPQMPLLLIQGQRRVGKTSLINYLEQLLGSGFKIVKLDMQSGTNKRFDTFVQNINQALNEMLGIDESIKTSDDILESWNAFEAYLTEHTKALNYKVIIAFDEYESFHKHIVKKQGEDILANMRSFMQSQNQVIFLFSGMLRISDLTSPNWDEYFPNAQRLKVDYLSKEESLELITKPVDDFNLLYTDDVANDVYELTMGHPQLLQTLCSSIVTLANQTNQKNVSQEMVRKAKEEVFEVNDMPMTIFWREFCNDAEREAIEKILSHKEIRKETREQKRAVARLLDYGFITKEMTIHVPLFEKWLEERRDLIEI